jgi:hypothetical protein
VFMAIQELRDFGLYNSIAPGVNTVDSYRSAAHAHLYLTCRLREPQAELTLPYVLPSRTTGWGRRLDNWGISARLDPA